MRILVWLVLLALVPLAGEAAADSTKESFHFQDGSVAYRSERVLSGENATRLRSTADRDPRDSSVSEHEAQRAWSIYQKSLFPTGPDATAGFYNVRANGQPLLGGTTLRTELLGIVGPVASETPVTILYEGVINTTFDSLRSLGASRGASDYHPRLTLSFQADGLDSLDCTGVPVARPASDTIELLPPASAWSLQCAPMEGGAPGVATSRTRASPLPGVTGAGIVLALLRRRRG